MQTPLPERPHSGYSIPCVALWECRRLDAAFLFRRSRWVWHRFPGYTERLLGHGFG